MINCSLNYGEECFARMFRDFGESSLVLDIFFAHFAYLTYFKIIFFFFDNSFLHLHPHLFNN